MTSVERGAALLGRAHRSWRRIRDLAAFSPTPVLTAGALVLARLTNAEFAQVPCVYHLNGFPLLARPRDIFGVEDVFLAHEYAFLSPVLAGLDTPLIFDIGANVGSFSLFVHARCPTARIVAVEPAPDTAELLRRNIRQWSALRGEVVEAAVWTSAHPVFLRGTGPSASRRIGAPGVGVQVRSVPLSNLIGGAGSERIALLKLDIEGAEEQVLGHVQPHLGSVDRLVVEVHPHESDVDTVRRLLRASFPAVETIRHVARGKALLFATR